MEDKSILSEITVYVTHRPEGLICPTKSFKETFWKFRVTGKAGNKLGFFRAKPHQVSKYPHPQRHDHRGK